MSEIQTMSAEEYLEESLKSIDFTSLDEFLYSHVRTEMTFSELVSQVSVNGLEALNAENICTLFYDAFMYELSIAKPIFIKMLCFSILFSVIHRLLVTRNKYISEIGFLTIYSTLMVLLMQSFFLVRDIALDAIDSLLSFLNALIPTYAVTLAFSGNSVSGAMLYEVAFFMVYLIELLMKSVLSPMIHIFILILFLNHLFDEDRLSKLANFLEKIVHLVLKSVFAAVIGLGVVQSMISPAKDRLAENVMLSGLSAIPGIGNAIGSTGEIILSCGMVIKNSVGVVGLVILAFLAIVPLLKIGCMWLMYHGLSIILQPVADQRITECVYGVARGCDLYMKIVMYSMTLFFVLFSMVSMATSFVF